ncbi:extracellular solute-binding protein [Cohnella abietis]|uniref:Sugar ABC transporter substrate-binding protein n=1 Tax=Cohnella abietis TaxID=2507935 RepID=A0A3T1D0H4_9BACL|nr:extracellular solute-binding protein [Cohnella abietis]BBI31584.1 sugar ABC transporter substrate-binding protein [Cohnella abietis]
MMGKKTSIILLSSMVVLSSALSACSSNKATSPNSTDATSTQSADPSQSKEVVTIRVQMGDGELTKEQIQEFNDSHPNIKVERVDADYNKLMAMVAANNAPDIIRVTGANELPSYVLRGLALNLTSYFESSEVFKKDDLLPIVDVFKFNGTTQGQGDMYGVPKDWSPDFTIFYNKKLFQEAGIPLPSATEPLTWDQIFDYAGKLTKKDGDKITQHGFLNFLGYGGAGDITPTQETLILQLQQQGKSLFDEQGKANFNSPEAIAILKQWVDAVKAGYGQSPLNPAVEWSPILFSDSKVGMIMAGYFLSNFFKENEKSKDHLSDFALMPTPVMAGGTQISATGAATGGIIYSKTKHPKEAWEVFEWYFGGKPADDRAKSGNGLPIFNSKMALLPQNNDFEKQSYEVVQNELKHLQPLKFNNFISAQGMQKIFEKLIVPVYFDKDTLESALEKMNTDANLLIQEGKEIAGVK